MENINTCVEMMQLTLWLLADEVDFGGTVYVVQLGVGELPTVFVLLVVVRVTAFPGSEITENS